ncbi:MAG: hypothetical protein CME26_11840 [Gemmatimonadetes bacterium]|nr:hypothetical protein [Gemmatimonadota bacterium]
MVLGFHTCAPDREEAYMFSVSSGPVLVSQQAETAIITLNRPEKRNAVNDEMLLTMIDALNAAIADDDVHSILLSGRGDYFSAGRDIKTRRKDEVGSSPSEDESTNQPVSHKSGPFLRALSLLLDCQKPTVAVVQGFALGGGQALTLACDFLVAERGARFGCVEMAYGFPAGMNIALLTRHLGRRLALEIAMTGELYSAERYWEIGLVNRLAQPGELDTTVSSFVEVLNKLEPWAVQRTKNTLRMAIASGDTTAMYIGDELNQNMFSSGRGSVHSGSSDVRRNIKDSLTPETE